MTFHVMNVYIMNLSLFTIDTRTHCANDLASKVIGNYSKAKMLITRFLTERMARALRQRLPPHHHAKETQSQSDCKYESQRKHK